MAWVYVCIGTLIAVGVGVFVYLVVFHGNAFGKVSPPIPAPEAIAPLPPEPAPIQPITLSDIHVSVVRIGTDITAILAWENRLPDKPFHLWVSVEDGNLILHSPDNEPRTVEILPNQALSLFGSTLYHEASDNRLAIDLQVETDKPKE